MTKIIIRKKLFAEIFLTTGLIMTIVSVSLFTRYPRLIFLFFGGLFFMFVGNRFYQNVKRTIREDIVPGIIKEKLGKSIYSPNEGFNQNVVYDSHLLKEHDRFYSEDLVSGEVFGNKFQMSEIYILNVKRDIKKFSSELLFSGLFIEVNMESRLPSSIYLTPKDSRMYDYLDVNDKHTPKNQMIDENFDVFTKDASGLDILFTERICDAIMRTKMVFPELFIAVKKHATYIAINSRKDTLDVHLFKRLNRNFITSFTRELEEIKQLVSALDRKRH